MPVGPGWGRGSRGGAFRVFGEIVDDGDTSPVPEPDDAAGDGSDHDRPAQPAQATPGLRLPPPVGRQGEMHRRSPPSERASDCPCDPPPWYNA